jgi:A/G-specific adenine glycosylase
VTVHSPDDFAARLLRWYDANARALPWRILPGSPDVPDPYRIWLAEIMLQQTTVAAVAGYFARFTKRWPNVAALAGAEDADVMAAWAGLGYYARARNLLACARVVARDYGGAFPASEAALRALPGIGDYTAAAVAAIAFGERAVVVDANIERVMARHAAIADPLPGAKRAIRAALLPLIPADRPGDFAQALMDLGAGLCAVRAPRCGACPLAATCQAKAQGIAASLPVKAAKRAKPTRYGTALWIERDGQLWLVQRPARGMLGGMRALPGDDWNGDSPAPAAATVLAIIRGSSADMQGDGEWWPINALDEAGLPTLYRKAASAMTRAVSREKA